MYRIVLTKQAQKDYNYWESSGNMVALEKIIELLEDITKHPFVGIGKPEQLKYDLAGKWSRHINNKHRIVYSVNNETMEVNVFTMQYHYTKK